MLPRWIFCCWMLLCLAGCQAGPPLAIPTSTTDSGKQTDATAPSSPGIANPASVYCEEHGGVLELRTDTEGGVSGVCIFTDGSECEEWAYFRGECQPGQPETQPAATPDLADYAFPAEIDPAGQYLFYLHGKIIEDQGLPAVSTDYGEYEYMEILQRMEAGGLRVISEQRPKDTDVQVYARRVAGQVQSLLDAGVSAENITVVGASKGAWIAALVSNLLENEQVHYVLMALCNPEAVKDLIDEQVGLHGKVLSIYDAPDEFAGSCAQLFEYSRGKGLAAHEEIVLELGLGHGMLYQPVEEWVIPVLDWGGGD